MKRKNVFQLTALLFCSVFVLSSCKSEEEPAFQPQKLGLSVVPVTYYDGTQQTWTEDTKVGVNFSFDEPTVRNQPWKWSGEGNVFSNSVGNMYLKTVNGTTVSVYYPYEGSDGELQEVALDCTNQLELQDYLFGKTDANPNSIGNTTVALGHVMCQISLKILATAQRIKTAKIYGLVMKGRLDTRSGEISNEDDGEPLVFEGDNLREISFLAIPQSVTMEQPARITVTTNKDKEYTFSFTGNFNPGETFHPEEIDFTEGQPIPATFIADPVAQWQVGDIKDITPTEN